MLTHKNISLYSSFILLGSLCFVANIYAQQKHHGMKKQSEHNPSMQTVSGHKMKSGGHHGGGHGSVIKGLDKFSTSAYKGSPAASSIQIVKPSTMVGNASKGKVIAYNRSLGRCLNCHILEADGKQAGTVGPNLSNYANLNRSDEYTFQQIWDARKHNAQTIMPPLGTNGLINRHQALHVITYLKR